MYPFRRAVFYLPWIVGGFVATAYGETADLKCAATLGGRDLYVSIDMSANRATFWENGGTRETGLSSPAKISEQQVTWSANISTGYSGGLVENFTLDRNTGALSNVVTSNGRTHSNAWTCSRASRVL